MRNIIDFMTILYFAISPYVIIVCWTKYRHYKEYWELEVKKSDMYHELFETEHKYAKSLEKIIQEKDANKTTP